MILFTCWKEIFANEGATRFDLVDELYILPAKLPTSMFQFAAWLEDWMAKLVVADEFAERIEPRRAMAVLMNVGKPLQTSDNIFMAERVAIFRESGLRDDVTVANLQDVCLKIVVLARARARELQVDQQVERAQQPLSCKNEIIASIHTPEPPGSVYAVALSHTIFRLVPVLADNTLLDATVRNPPLVSPMLSLKEEQLMPRLRVREPKTRRKLR